MAAPLISAATCLGCGCTCDDIEVVLTGSTIVEARRACELGARWFGTGAASARARVEGHDMSLADAVERAATLLSQATRPRVLLGPDVSCETYREAIACADFLRARVDLFPGSSVAAVLAIQERGIATATLGEIRNRADVIVFWGVDPSVGYPRYESRYVPRPVGRHLPDGRASRTVIAVDVDDSRGPADADARIEVTKSSEIDTLVALAALLGGATVPQNGVGSHFPVWRTASTLATFLRRGRYVALVADAELDGDNQSHGRIHRLLALGHALNVLSRGALSLLGGGGNRNGAAAVLTRQTGYPDCVDFTSGVPRYRPRDTATGGSHDAILLVGSPARFTATDIEILGTAPTIVIGPHASESALAHAQVIIDSATAGIQSSGTAVRMDEVPVPLKQLVSGATDATVICEILRRRLQTVQS